LNGTGEINISGYIELELLKSRLRLPLEASDTTYLRLIVSPSGILPDCVTMEIDEDRIERLDIELNPLFMAEFLRAQFK
jgi:hypothetical protein